MKKYDKSVIKSVRQLRRVLSPREVLTLFRSAHALALGIHLPMLIQFLAQLRDVELFALTWAAWDGQRLRVASSPRCGERAIEVHPVLAAALNAAAKAAHDPDAPIMVISRAEYRQRLRRAQELAGIADLGKSPLRLAGAFMSFPDKTQAEYLGSKPCSRVTAKNYTGSPQESWHEIIKRLTPEALAGAGITVRELVTRFGQETISTSFSCDDPKGHLRFPTGYRRVTARILANLAKFAGDSRADDMTADVAVAFLKHEVATRRAQGRIGLSRPSILKIAHTAGSVFRHGIERGLCQADPFWGLRA
jgi:hypothetical protein